jgi:tellurite resistance protein TerC
MELELSFVFIIVQLIFLECILSIDNAAVMGAMVAHLPTDKPTPWPTWMRKTGARLDPWLGSQQEAALKVGLFGAYAGRILMLALATWIIQVIWVQIIGALYLIYLGVSHFARLQSATEQEGDEKPKRGFWGVVVALNLADLAFSLDNVVAAVALSDHFWVVVLGVAVGMLVIRFAATMFTRLISWEPALEHAAYLLLFAIGGQLIFERMTEIEIHDWMRFVISLAIIGLVLLFARIATLRQASSTVFRPFLGMARIIDGTVSLVTGLVVGIFLRVRM